MVAKYGQINRHNSPNNRIKADGENAGGADAASPVARWLCGTLEPLKIIMTQQNDPESQIALNRIFIGGLIGFIGGFIIGLILNPPTKGITTTTSDVQGLLIFSWVVYGFVASILGAILGLFGARKRKTIKKQ